MILTHYILVPLLPEVLISDTTLSQRCPLDTSEITKSLKFCQESNYFTLKMNLYRQTNGAALSSPVSSIVVDLFMNRFEDNIFPSILTPEIWSKYVEHTSLVL
uniref:Reverse transcriptase domain-containing protein n=1 Tax=Trichobilharzia regenti TaxID=157069 RepID=A0AA85K231_TRIRE|nr:unnamed protein product [Trichobilharzia regenti]